MLDLIDVMSFAASYALVEAAAAQLTAMRFEDAEIAAACAMPSPERERIAKAFIETADRIREELRHLDFRATQLVGVIEIPSE